MFTKVTLKVKFEPDQDLKKVKALAEGIRSVIAATTALSPENPLPDGLAGIDIEDLSGAGFRMEFAGFQDISHLDSVPAPFLEGALETDIDSLMCMVRDMNGGPWRACKMSYTTDTVVEYESAEEAQIARGDRAAMFG